MKYQELTEKANKIYLKNFSNETKFERALFFSWYCGLGDCTFCYMSVEKPKIDPKKARRRLSSIIAETIICKEMKWNIEFISGGYHSYTKKELLFLVKAVHNIIGEKQWLNIGTLNKQELEMFKPYIKGYAGTIETINLDIRKVVCPSKTLQPILKSFQYCDELGLEKVMTVIIGLGETIKDFEKLEQFVVENKIKRITFYALNPHPGTSFKKSPTKEVIGTWIAKTRIRFPKMNIIAGAWIDKTDYYAEFLKAGANDITKIPSIRKFNTQELQKIEKTIKATGRKFIGTLTKIPKVDWTKKVEGLDPQTFSKDLKVEIMKKLEKYLKQIKKNKK